MKTRLQGAVILAVAALLACASPALADNFPAKDATGTTQTFCSRLVGGLQYPCHLLFGMFGATPTAIAVDGSGNVATTVQASVLPNGAATSAKQDIANSSLGTIASNTGAGATAAGQTTANTTLSTIATNTGAGATSALQTSANGKLDTIVANTTGLATSAAQATAATTLSTIATNTTGASTAANQTAPQANAGSDATKALAVQGLTGGKLVGTAPGSTASTTDRSITVATGGTAQQVMAVNASRRSFYVFNPNASGTCWASFTTTTPAANGLGAFPIPSQGGFGMEVSPTTSALYANCPTTGQFITAWESQ